MSKQQWIKENLKEGELYAGLILGKDGQPDYHLALLPAKPPTERLNWQSAIDWAATTGGELPTRREQSLLFANLREEFAQGYYWSSETYANDDDSAWGKYFLYGFQGGYHKSHEYRARAVRRIYIKD